MVHVVEPILEQRLWFCVGEALTFLHGRGLRSLPFLLRDGGGGAWKSYSFKSFTKAKPGGAVVVWLLYGPLP